MAPFTKIALAGATGNLGRPVLQALLDADFQVLVLSRIGGSSSKLQAHPNLLIAEVDFSSSEQMRPSLVGVDVVISCLATVAIDSQNPLIDAAEAAGVRRFIPAEFGMNTPNPQCQKLPVGAWKQSAQRYLANKHESNPAFTYTAVATGAFLDWGIEVGFIVDPSRHTATLYNGGDVPFSTTNLADIARALIGVIRNPAQTANRVVYVHSTVTTQNKLIGYAVEKDGKAWTTTVKDTDTLLKESFAAFEKADGAASTEAAANGFSACACFTSSYGCDFSQHLDNDLLGVETLDEASVRSLVQKHLF
ncbi:hypothetical protein N3K66_007761 [Trichothecium roseum]|uniref:Uncharacterized protein n=1 Tax=Trichothecium roseum TaxID=47278 RepID=A0ACC0UUV5_9HYPO|nr:hypothetical protein N3K66_007761 [Trichothecium roseum]